MRPKEKDKLIRQQISREYEKYYRLAFKYAGNEHDALDVVQEAAYKAILRSGKLRDPEKADSWICSIVVNQAYDHFRKNKDHAGMDELMTVAAREEDSYIDLQRALGKLKPEDRKIIRMKYYEDLRISDIAKRMGMNENTVKSRLYRSLDRVRDLYIGG